MATVTQRTKQVKQPRGGFINPKTLKVQDCDPIRDLNPQENISAGIVGIAVDYLTRFRQGTPAQEAFEISLLGAGLVGDLDYAASLVSAIQDFDDRAVIAACRLAGYDVAFRAGLMGYREVREISPDDATIGNVLTMVERSDAFLKAQGPLVADGFTMPGGYTETVTNGDGDFITRDTLWDFKVSVAAPKKEHTLQVLMYYLMGRHAALPEFAGIENLGIYNPRLSKAYTVAVVDIPADVIAEVEADVIGY